jgi:hypothetical protein
MRKIYCPPEHLKLLLQCVIIEREKEKARLRDLIEHDRVLRLERNER